MRIHTKMILTSLCGLVICLTATQVFQFRKTSQLLREFSRNTLNILEDQEKINADNMQVALSTSLEMGEMDAFFSTLKGLTKVKGLLEASLFEPAKATVVRSSVASAIDRPLPAEIRAEFAAAPEKKITRREKDTFEIYQPYVVKKNCMKCHDDWQQGNFAGATYFRFSTAALKTAEDSAAAISERISRTAQGYALLSVMGATIVLAALLYFLVNKIVHKPLGNFCQVLERVRQGDLSEHFESKSSDEIGEMARAFESMMAGLRKKAELATHIAEGDISRDVPIVSDRDTLGQSLKEMTKNLNHLLAEVHTAATRVLEGARSISSASHALSDGATEQASAVEEISASLSEVSSQVRNSAGYAGQAKSSSDLAQSAAEVGQQKVSFMMSSMKEIAESSKSIVSVVKVIDDIAFQTNLLALNAAVEAARAGKHGKGFSVVAEEVRTLASRSAKAAKETAEGIAASLLKIEKGNESAEETGKALSVIAEHVNKVKSLIAIIAEASGQQSRAVVEVSEGLTQIDHVTQRNAASAEETAAEAGDLTDRAQHLDGLLRRFRLKE